jgi:ribosomal protein S6--L-glutamate ligase
MRTKQLDNRLLIGRSEWCGLPNLNIPAIKAKIDTGAKTSSIHAYNITSYQQQGRLMVSYDLHPVQSNDKLTVQCHSEVIDQRAVMSSNGQKELRFVIETLLSLGERSWQIELTLSNRDPLRFRLLLGREAFGTKVIIDPAISCNQQKLSKKVQQKLIAEAQSLNDRD